MSAADPRQIQQQAADLRPLTLGELLDQTFSIYRNHFWVFAGIMMGPSLVLFMLNMSMAPFTVSRAQPAQPSIGLVGGALFAGIIFLLLYFLLVGAAQAATVFAVSDLYLGRTATIRGSYNRVTGKVFTVLSTMSLMWILTGIGFLLFIIPGVILLCRTIVAVPAAMLENLGPMKAISRSMQLTKGHAVKIFVMFVLLFIVSIAAAAIFQVPFTFLGGSPLKPHALPFSLLLLRQVGTFLTQVLVGPLGTIAFSLMYYNLRVRKEAFDIQHLMTSLDVYPATGTASGI